LAKKKKENPDYALNLTHRFAKSRQREGSGTAKKLEEPVSTAPSGLFFITQYFLISRINAIFMLFIPDAIFAL